MPNTQSFKVSVIVPNYNHARFLRKRVDSILGQTFQDFELILLDDCSTDDSRLILSQYADDARVRIEVNGANSGSPFKQWTKGVRLARGEYVWIAESDDYADSQMLERLVAVLDAQPEVVFVNCRSRRVFEDGRLDDYADLYLVELDRDKWTDDFNVDGREECRNYFVHLNPVCNASSVVFRRAVYDRVGGADERLRYCGDWKIWAAMALNGRVAHVKEALNYHRLHAATVTASSTREGIAASEFLHVMRWIIGQVTPTDAARQKLSETLAWSWAHAVTTRGHVPLRRRWSALRDAIAIDPSILRATIPAGFGALTRKFLHR